EIKTLKKILAALIICLASAFLLHVFKHMGSSPSTTRTVFLTRSTVHGKFGFGINDCYVSRLHPNTPAHGKLEVGDLIERVNSIDVEAMSEDELLDLI
ncbi:hypothetical protein PENTCL1PPCAC_10299, partial [Pristionchus entomophagus]